MPIYEYQCSGCGHTLEAFQKMSDAALVTCPNCKQSTLQKLMSASGFQLKGTGWYATDFKDKGKAKAKDDTSEQTTATAATDSKPTTDSKETKSESSSASSTSSTTTTESKQ